MQFAKCSILFIPLLALMACNSDNDGTDPTTVAPTTNWDAMNCIETGGTNLIKCTVSPAYTSMSIQNDMLPILEFFDADEDTVVWIQAYGAAGGNGTNYQAPSDDTGFGGSGGVAQTQTTLADIGVDKTLYYFIGNEGTHDAVEGSGGSGGSATMLFSELPASGGEYSTFQDSVLVIAGGGGGGSVANDFTSGSNGGDGAVLLGGPFGLNVPGYCYIDESPAGGPATSSQTYCPATGGERNDANSGGSAPGPGFGGAGNSNTGIDGFGGLGGYYDGNSQVSGYLNISASSVTAMGIDATAGGGAGVTIASGGIWGGAGGGGYGGGGSGLSGGSIDDHGAGGGGGGSLVKIPTVFDSDAPQGGEGINPSNAEGALVLIFNLDPDVIWSST